MILKKVSSQAGIVDLSTAKFRLDELGVPGEKLMVKVVVSSLDMDKELILFGTYKVGRRHAQIATRELNQLGNSVFVSAIKRYSVEDFVEDVNDWLKTHPLHGGLGLVADRRGVCFQVEGRILPLKINRIYASAARACAIVECRAKILKIVFGSGKVELFDLQRRKLVGLTMKEGEFVLLRAFQHPESETN